MICKEENCKGDILVNAQLVFKWDRETGKPVKPRINVENAVCVACHNTVDNEALTKIDKTAKDLLTKSEE